MILHEPSRKDLNDSQIARYLHWLKENRFGDFKTYADLHRWSVEKPERFWESIWNWGGMIAHSPFKEVLPKKKMPGAKWFTGAKLNFAENLLRFAQVGSREKRALSAFSEKKPTVRMTYGELFDAVSRLAHFFRSRGVGVGDRVAATVTNSPEAIVGMLAATSIGAVWSSCSPDFGTPGVLDRFGQIEPKVLIAETSYQYNGKEFNCVEKIESVLKSISAIKDVIVVGPGLKSRSRASIHSWKELVSKGPVPSLSFESLPFDHPAYVLYSSGTTGVPKCIVHGAGGVLLQHMKELRLHTDVQLNDKFFYFTTCGWMMWNWLVSGLMTGAELILVDGSPSYPTLGRLWELAETEKITVFGTSAKFIGACRNAGLSPKSKFSLSHLKAILSTGSPLLPEDFDWVYEQVSREVRLSSISGGTDIVSCFVLGNPLLPVRRGEIQCKGLGMDVAAWNEKGKEVVNEKGELVCKLPAPSMPIYFWNDPDGKKYRDAYFDVYPAVWRHGDFILFTESGGSIIYGRSDATLNPGGVRIGTAEIYRQVETIEEIQDSLAVGFPQDGDEKIVLFVVLKKGFAFTDDLEKKIRERIRSQTTARHVPWKMFSVSEIPYTISGKKVELAVAKVLRGEEVKNKDALVNPSVLEEFARFQLK